MIEAKRKEGESTGAFLMRFTRKIQQSHILQKARKARFLERKKSKRQIRESAIRRAKIAQEKERLYKLGKISENEYKKGN